jgi:hypothetical protein
MKTKTVAVAKPVKTVAVTAKKTLSPAQRSEVSRRAANAAWKTMHSAAYKRAAAKSPKAVAAFLASR